MTRTVEWREVETRPGAGSLSTIGDEAWWEEPIGEWVAALRLASSGGRVIATELRIFPELRHDTTPPGEWDHRSPGVPEDGLPDKPRRSVSITKMVARARRALAEEAEGVPQEEIALAAKHGDPSFISTPLIGAGFDDWPALNLPNRSERPGSRGWGIDWHLRIAVVYVRHDEDGSTTPTKDTAVELRMDDALVSKAIYRCRKKYGLLTQVPPGRRSGGRLTNYALRLIKERTTKGGTGS